MTPIAEHRPRPVIAVLAGAVGGLLLGATGAVVQAGTSTVAGHSVPWGVVLTLAVVVVAVRAAVWWARSRSAGAAVTAGWMVATFVLAQTGPGGDVLLPDDAGSKVYLLGGAVLAAVSAALPLPRHADAEPVALSATVLDATALGTAEPPAIEVPES